MDDSDNGSVEQNMAFSRHPAADAWGKVSAVLVQSGSLLRLLSAGHTH
jgi:hypothetical protein